MCQASLDLAQWGFGSKAGSSREAVARWVATGFLPRPQPIAKLHLSLKKRETFFALTSSLFAYFG